VLVVLFHARLPGFEAGFLGVDVFFVLSGYLITTLLLVEIDRTGSINWRRFVLRRLWRLAPALGTLCLGMLVLSIWAWPSTLQPWLEVFLTLTYLSDLTVSILHAPQMLGHSWSLSVEEHFYLLWPVALLVLARVGPSWVPVLILGLYLAASLWRIEALALGTEWRDVYFRLDTRLSGLMFGACLAALCRGWSLAWLASLPLWLVAVPVAGLLLAHGDWRDDGMLIWGVPAVELATAALILGVRGGGGGLAALLSLAPLRWLGKLSYSLYLWHYPVLRLLRDQGDWQIALLVGLPVSLALAALSYVTVERWGLLMRAKMGL
jgi:peptidoglycan/LPS O-acetylase OafA/YrhL